MGQGLSIGVGLALAGKSPDRLPYRVWVLCGDSEMAEGSTWETFCYGGRAPPGQTLMSHGVKTVGDRLGRCGRPRTA